MIARIWSWLFPPSVRPTLIASGKTWIAWSDVRGEDGEPKREAITWFFYEHPKTGLRTWSTETYGYAKRFEKGLDNKWAAEVRFWQETGKLPDWADPVAVSIICGNN